MASATFGKRKSSLPMSRGGDFARTASTPPLTFDTATSTLGPIPKAPDVREYNPHPQPTDVTVRVGQPVKFLRFASALIDTVIMMAMFVGLVVLFADPAAETPEMNQAEAITLLAMLILPGLLYGIIMEASPLQGTVGNLPQAHASLT